MGHAFCRWRQRHTLALCSTGEPLVQFPRIRHLWVPLGTGVVKTFRWTSQVFSVSELSDELLVHVANWNPAVPGWPDFRDDDSPAPYLNLISALESLDGFSLLHNNGQDYGDTFFGYFLHCPTDTDTFDDWGLYVALCRFAPVGIYGEEHRKWGPTGGHGGGPGLNNAYVVSNADWQPVAATARKLMVDHGVYLPTREEMERPLNFELPKLFRDNANCGQSVNFHVLFNDLY